MKEFSAIRISLSSSEDIRKRSYGEVKKPETINYRTLAPEKDGLFCESIFGPVKDWQCSCGKYKRIRYKGIICERCGVEVTKSKVRRERMGHIELEVPVAHIWYSKGIPNIISILLGVTPKDLEMVLYFARYLVTEVGDSAFQPMEVITEQEYRLASEIEGRNFKAGMGAEAVLEALQSFNLLEIEKRLREELEDSDSVQKKKKLIKRLKIIKYFINSGNKAEWMIIKALPVIPADLRPMVQLDGGRFATSDLNDLYRRVLNRNRRLKKLNEMDAPEIILRNEKRMLQEAVDALIDNSRRDTPVVTQNNRELKSLSDMLKGKQGRFRQNLLGKRVDYSGRSVIVVGPNLKLHQCGLPKKMALELYKPFIMKELVRRELAPNIKAAKRIIDTEKDVVWEVAEEIIKGHPVLLNRAPTLHKLSMQAFEPVLIEGKAIRLHPLVCSAFNADFDGDQMAVHLVLSPESIMEAKTFMLSSNNILSPKDGKPTVLPSREMLMGCYYMTKIKKIAKGTGKMFASTNEAKMAYFHGQIEVNALINVRINGQIFETSIGRILLNDIIPEEMRDYTKVFVNKDFKVLISNMYKKHGASVTAEIINEIKDFGYKYGTLAGISIGVNDLVIPSIKPKMLEETSKKVAEIEKEYKEGKIVKDERYRKIVDLWNDTTVKMTNRLMEEIDEFNPVYMMSQSGARGGVTQMRQLSTMKGLVADTQGRIQEVPITSNFREGLNVLEFFMSSHGARKGSADKALRTADSGYLTRRLVDIAHDVIVNEDDCNTKEGIEVSTIYDDRGKVIETLYERVLGRRSAEDLKVEEKLILEKDALIDDERWRSLEEKEIRTIKIRSPLTCRAHRGVCRACYGIDLSTHRDVILGEAVGVIAAQSIGEPGTQLTMRTFHTGGVTEKKSVLTEIIAPSNGKILYKDLDYVEIENNQRKIISKNARIVIGKNELYIPAGTILAVEEGEQVKKGHLLGQMPAYAIEFIAEYDGVVDLNGLYTKEKIDKRYNVKEIIVLKSHIPKVDHPHVLLRDKRKGKVLTDYLIPPGAFLIAKDGDKIKKGDVIAKYLKEDERSSKDITGGLPRVQQLFETRTPATKAVIAENAGVVEVLDKRKKGMRVLLIKDSDNVNMTQEYLIPAGERMIVTTGDVVEKGSKLTEGIIHVSNLLAVKGIIAAQEYLLDAVQQVYREQGVEINDKHIEVIIKQMFKKVKILNSGDSLYLEGEVVSKRKVEDENEKLKKEGKTLISYEPVIQGITKAAIDTESFISAASFQETTKVLSLAAIKGSVDRLTGLKENVIIGRQIPAGTGLPLYKELFKE